MKPKIIAFLVIGALVMVVVMSVSGINHTNRIVAEIKKDKVVKVKQNEEKPQPSEKKTKLYKGPNHHMQFGIRDFYPPKNGASEDEWVAYYERKHENFERRPEDLEKMYRTPEEIQAILNRYDKKIQKYQLALQTNPDDAEAKDEIGDLKKSKAFVRVMAKQFEKYKASQK